MARLSSYQRAAAAAFEQANAFPSLQSASLQPLELEGGEEGQEGRRKRCERATLTFIMRNAVK